MSREVPPWRGVLWDVAVHGGRYILFVPVVSALMLLWLAQTLLAAPALVAAGLAMRGRRHRELLEVPRPGARVGAATTGRLYDRTHDVSKLYGCEVRNVAYRWHVFAGVVQTVRNRASRPTALDFGAGSLRETYELALLGFDVTAIDRNVEALRAFESMYDWSATGRRARVSSAALAELPDDLRFDVITAFDVLEHIEDLTPVMEQLHRRLDPNGAIFVSVPNRRALYERFWRFARRLPIRHGHEPGVDHLQFRDPTEWRSLFEQHGFVVVDHDMSVGFMVNDCWTAFYKIPLSTVADPVLARIWWAFGRTYRAGSFGELLCPAWLMEAVHRLDLLLKPVFRERWGWNLFVLGRAVR